MKTDFGASGNHFFLFLRQQSTATSRSSFSFNQNILETWKRGFYLFCLLFYSEFFFRKWKLLLKLGGSPFFEDEPHSCQWTPSLSIFFRDFLQWKQLFRVAETYFSISFTRLTQMDFLPGGNIIFWSVLFHCQQKPLLE